MIAFVLLLLWAPSVIGDDCSTTFSCNEGNCEDQDFVWRGINVLDENFCYGEGLSFGYPPTGEDCTIVTKPTFAEETWLLKPVSFTDQPTVCAVGTTANKSAYCKCTPEPKTKSTLSTGAIIGITLAVLFIVITIGFIYRSQLTTNRFAQQTGEQLIQ